MAEGADNPPPLSPLQPREHRVSPSGLLPATLQSFITQHFTDRLLLYPSVAL